MSEFLFTVSSKLAKAGSANLADLTFPSLIPTITKPAATATKAVIPWRNNSGFCPNAILLMPFGTGANNTTFSMRLTGWRQVQGSGLTTLWVPQRLFEVTCTLSNIVGIAASPVLATERLADTIALVASTPALSTLEIYSPADDGQGGWILCDGMGCELLEISVDMTGATDGNVLWSSF